MRVKAGGFTSVVPALGQALKEQVKSFKLQAKGRMPELEAQIKKMVQLETQKIKQARAEDRDPIEDSLSSRVKAGGITSTVACSGSSTLNPTVLKLKGRVPQVEVNEETAEEEKIDDPIDIATKARLKTGSIVGIVQDQSQNNSQVTKLKLKGSVPIEPKEPEQSIEYPNNDPIENSLNQRKQLGGLTEIDKSASSTHTISSLKVKGTIPECLF